MILASIMDLDGPTFLALYGLFFIIALAWSIRRRSRVYEKFSLPGAAETQLTDPYEIAYLAGGAPRCAQVAVVKLLHSGAVEWQRKRILRDSRLVAIGMADAAFNDIERALFSVISSRGKSGLRMMEVTTHIVSRLSGVESRLAVLGLRPTASEASGRGCFIILPLSALMLFGGWRFVAGFTNNKPILFLVVLLAITAIVAAILASHKKKLTPEGEDLLTRMRAHRESQGDTLYSLSLFGVGRSGDPGLSGLDSALRKDLSKLENNHGSSGCGGGGSGAGCSSGCSSGCGGGGGGGGGCGGCGGD
jgi:uncharacterized protein (TIGR04222 family)